MNRFWKNLILPLFNEFQPKYIVEIGCFKGDNTKNLLDYCLINDSKLIAIDPNPDPIFDSDKFKDEFKDKFDYYKELSLERIPLLENFDAVLIDGDHNWYTVYNELKLIEKKFDNENFPLILFHDVSWPYARRDLYYDPSNIPSQYRHPYKKAAMFPGVEELVEIGLNPTLNNAIHENTQKNGVLTAIEDFLNETSLDLSFYNLNAFYGFGLMCSNHLLDEETILKIFYESNVIGLLEDAYLKMRFSNERVFHENKKEIAHKDNVIADLEGVVSSNERLIADRDNVIADLESSVSSLNVQIDDFRNSELLLNDKISVLEGVVSSNERLIADLESSVSSFNLKVNELNEKNSFLEKEVLALEEIKENQEKTIEILNKKNYNLNHENYSLKDDNSILLKNNKMFIEDLRDSNLRNQDLEDAINELKKDYSLLKIEKDSITSSWAWKLTYPLRKVFGFFN